MGEDNQCSAALTVEIEGWGNKHSFSTSLVEETSACLKAVRKSFLRVYVCKGQAASLLDLISLLCDHGLDFVFVAVLRPCMC